jgi:hypothetical protein
LIGGTFQGLYPNPGLVFGAIKVNADGDSLWTFRTDGGRCNAGGQTSDGGYVLAGKSAGDAWLVKLSAEETPVGDNQETLPHTFSLSQNYPNPFNSRTRIDFSLPITTQLSLRVFDLAGRQVATLVNDRLQAGDHSLDFEAGRLPSGIYFYQLQAGTWSVTHKMVFLR